MDVEMADSLQASEFEGLVEGATPLFEEIVQPAGQKVTWDLEKDARGRPSLVGRVWDDADLQASIGLRPEEFRLENHFRARLRDLHEAISRVARWRRHLLALYDKVEPWAQGIPGGPPFVEREKVVLRELKSGSYEVPRLLISLGNRTMSIDPVGYSIVGADGRVDFKGVGGPFVVLLREEDGGWFILEYGLGATSIPLTRESFLRAAEACLDG